MKVHLVISGVFPKNYVLLGMFGSLEEAQEFTIPRLRILQDTFGTTIPIEERKFIPTIITREFGEFTILHPWVDIMLDSKGRQSSLNLNFRNSPVGPGDLISRKVLGRTSDRPYFQGVADNFAQASKLADKAFLEWKTSRFVPPSPPGDEVPVFGNESTLDHVPVTTSTFWWENAAPVAATMITDLEAPE